MMRSTVLLYLFLFAIQVFLSQSLTKWNCGQKLLENVTVSWTLLPGSQRDCYNYIDPNTTKKAELLEGTDQILNVSQITSKASKSKLSLSDKLTLCAKAAMGRGFETFGFHNKLCYGIREKHDQQFHKTGRCKWTGTKCAVDGSHKFGCQRRKVESVNRCDCGDQSGGRGEFFSLYLLQTHRVELWVETDDVFNRTVKMFNKTLPEFLELYEKVKSSTDEFLEEHKLCGVGEIDKMSTRPSCIPGRISLRFLFRTSYMDVPMVHRHLAAIAFPNMTIYSKLTAQHSFTTLCNYSYLRVALEFGDSLTKPTVYIRSEQHNISFTITSTCAIDAEVQYDLKLIKIEDGVFSNSCIPLCNGTVTNVSKTAITCTIEPFSLLHGIYYAEVKVWSTVNATSFDHQYKFINMSKAPLVAGINMTGNCFYTAGQSLILHGKNSFDRDIYETAEEALPYDEDLNYIWTCRKSKESVSITISNVYSRPIVEEGNKTGKTGGCFGNGYGPFKYNTRSIKFKSNSVKAGEVLVFKMFVTKGFRNAETTLKCTVLLSPPKHSIRCLYNCGRLMKTTTRLGLEPFCGDPKGCSINLKHSWSVFVDTEERFQIGTESEVIWQSVEDIKTLTDETNVYFVLKEYILQQNKTYKVQHTVKNSQNGTLINEHIFTTNILPHAGKCEPDKTELLAVTEPLRVVCHSWVNEDGILTGYEAWSLSPNGLPKLIHFGNSSIFSLRVPLGNVANNFSLQVELKVFDEFESTSVILNLTAKSPEIKNPTKDIANMLASEGDEDDMTKAQKGLGVLSLFEVGNVTAANKTQMRDQVIASMAGIPINGTQNIQMTTGVLIDSTAKSDELSVDGQMMSINAASTMVDSFSDFNSTNDPIVFDSVGTSLLHLAGNVFDGAAAIAKNGGNEIAQPLPTASNTSNTTMTAQESVARTAVNTSNNLANTLLGKLLGGEKSKKFQTPSLGLEIAKTDSSNLPESYSVNGGNVAVPSAMKSLLENSTKCTINKTCLAAHSFISSKTMMAKNNPFTWGNGSIKIDSQVVTVEYSKSNGEAVIVDGLDEEFVMTIPTKPRNKTVKDSEFPNFVSPDTECVQHKFFVSKDFTAFELIMRLMQEKFLTVYIRYGKRVTKTKYDYEYYHPDLSSCVEPAPRDNCTGIHDFMECMGLEIGESLRKTQDKCATLKKNNTETYNETQCEAQNGTQFSNETHFDVMNQTKCEVANVTVPNVSFLTNSSHFRNLSACIDYHQIVTCPPCPVFVNNSGNGTSTNSSMEYSQFMKNISKFRPECGTSKAITVYDEHGNATNITKPLVCSKVQNFLNCKERSVEQYQKCEPLLTRKKLIYNRYEKCYKNIYRRFFGLDIFNKSGWYYVALCYNSTQYPPPTTPPPPTTTSPPTTTALPTTTKAPTTKVPTTEAPKTKAPTTKAPTAKAPTKKAPTSKAPTKKAPTTKAPTKKVPTARRRWTPTWRSKKRSKRSLETIRSFDYDDIDIEEVFDSYEPLDKNKQEYIHDNNEGLLNTDKNVLRRSRREATPQRRCAVVNEKPPPTAPPIPTEFPILMPQEFNQSSSLNYSFEVNLFMCLYWNATTDIWSTDGCRPHKNSSLTSLVCLCNHLTSFGTDLIVAPTPIDLDAVLAGFANLGETGNFSVLFTIIGLFLLFALAVVFARKADKRDIFLASKARVGSLDPHLGGVNYEIVISTGEYRRSGTTANVAMTIHGDKGSTEIIPLVDETGSSVDILSRGHVVSITVNVLDNVGDIQYIRIWHNNKGKDPAWFMKQITIRNVVTDEEWVFIHNDWFAVDKGDGKIDRRIYVASEDDKKNFKTLFFSHSSKSISEKHLWVSIILRPPSSAFTRVQRVCCCFSLLFTAMLTNAMFYQNDGGSDDTIHIGPVKMSLKQIIIGVESGLIVAPVNLLIMTLFRNARPKKRTKKEENDEFFKDSSDKKRQTRKKQSGYPHWVLHVAYTLCVLTVLASATVVVFYSMMWGTEKSNAWMVSVALSLVQDILLVQPLKIFVLAVLLSFIFRKPPNEDSIQTDTDEPKAASNEKDEKEKDSDNLKKPTLYYTEENYEPPDEEEVLEAQIYHSRKNAMRSSMKEIIIHLTFVILLSMTIFGSQSSHRYQFQEHLSDVFPGAESVTDAIQFWNWCKTVLIPGLYKNDWYNGQPFADEREGFISTRKAVLISMPRIRQVRVKSENCRAAKVFPAFIELFPECFPHYSMSQADESSPTTSNNPKGEIKLNDSVLSGEIGFERMCLQPFMVQTAEKLGTLPVVTNDGAYSGTTMVADLGYDSDTASETILNLKSDKWISRQTRSVFVEFVVFEPTSLLYAFARFTFEQRPTGAMLSAKRIEPYSLYGTANSSYNVMLQMIQFILVLFIIALFIRALFRLLKEKRQFFMKFWNIHLIVMLILSVTLIGLIFMRESYIGKLIKTIQENPYSRMSFDYVQYGTDVINSVAAVVIFLTTLKLLKLFHFNMKIQQFEQIMTLSRPFLFTYGFVFIVIFLGFAQAGNIFFGQVIPVYSNILRSFVNVFQMMFGKGLFFHELKDIDAALGPFYIFCYFMTTTLLLVNFFVAILNDSYVDGCEVVSSETNEDAILSAFMAAYMKTSLKDISDSLKKIPMHSKKHQDIFEDTKDPKTIKKSEAEYFLY